MKKSILNLGKALNKAAQKEINGGRLAAELEDGGRCIKDGALCTRIGGPKCCSGNCGNVSRNWGICQ